MMFTTTSKRLFNRCILLLIALAFALASCTQTKVTPNEPTGDVLEALVHGPVESAFLEPLKSSLHMTAYDGSQKLEDFDVLIFDGDTHTPAALKEDALVIQALRTGKHVLALDMTEAHKQDGLSGVLNASSCGNSPVYAVRMTQDANGRPLVQVFEARSGKTTSLDAGEVRSTPPTPEPCEEQVMTASAVPEVDASTEALFSGSLKEV